MPYQPTRSAPSNDRELFYWVYQELQRVGDEISTVSGVGGSVPVGGALGQALVKLSSANGDTGWGTVSVSWSQIADRPSTFPPSAHTHLISQVTGLQTALDAKAPVNHNHTKAEITDFSDGDYATAAQGLLADQALQPGEGVSLLVNDVGYLTSVSWGDVSGKPATFPPETHGHAIANVTGLEQRLTDLENGASITEDNVSFHCISGGDAYEDDFPVQLLTGGDASSIGEVMLLGGNASTLSLSQPQLFAGGHA